MVIVAKWPDISIITGIQVNLRASASIGVCVCVCASEWTRKNLRKDVCNGLTMLFIDPGDEN